METYTLTSHQCQVFIKGDPMIQCKEKMLKCSKSYNFLSYPDGSVRGEYTLMKNLSFRRYAWMHHGNLVSVESLQLSHTHI